MTGILLHKDHGVNASVYQCFLCGEDMGLILPGSQVKEFKDVGLADDSGKMNNKCGAISKEPCDKCKEIMEQGIIFISTKDNDHEYRTGGWCAIKESAVRKMGIDDSILTSICMQRVCFIADTVYDNLGLPRNQEINCIEEN